MVNNEIRDPCTLKSMFSVCFSKGKADFMYLIGVFSLFLPLSPPFCGLGFNHNIYDIADSTDWRAYIYKLYKVQKP